MSVFDPVPKARLLGPIKLTPTSFLVLGMVRLGFRSGYAIKKAADLSTQAFWPASLAQVYPELARLHKAQLLVRHSDPRGAQKRSAYALTETGEAALVRWLGSPELAPMQQRDEGLLRLMFADALSAADQAELIARVCDKDREKTAQMRQIASLAPPELKAVRYPDLVARFGAGTYGFSVRWMSRLQGHIEEAATRSGSSPASRPSANSADAARSTAAGPIKLTPTSYLILGLVRMGSTSGYMIRKVAELSTQAFWPISFGQLYPDLSRLHRAGLLADHSDKGRSRHAYSITEHGGAVLDGWLSSPLLGPTQIRHEAMLRLFFADALSAQDQIALVRRFREKNQRRYAGMREYLPRGDFMETEHGLRFPGFLAHYGVDKFGYSTRWLGRLQRRLEAAEPPSPGEPRANTSP